MKFTSIGAPASSPALNGCPPQAGEDAGVPEELSQTLPEGWDAEVVQHARKIAAARARQKIAPRQTLSRATTILVGVLLAAVLATLAFLGVGIFIVLIPIYLIPTFAAWQGNHRNLMGVAIPNIALGWTLVGWVAALIWAVYRER